MSSAFVGEEFWSEAWNRLGHNEERLRTWCDTLAETAPEALAQLELSWKTDQQAPADGLLLPPIVVSENEIQDCLRWAQWQLQSESGRVAEVGLVGSTDEALRSDCIRIASDPLSTSLSEIQAELEELDAFLESASTTTTTTTATTTTTTTTPPPPTLPPPPIPSPTLPPPPPRPVVAAPAPQCDPNYTGCVPIASDVDCAGGSGNGPAYTGTVQVIGNDIYDLDRDNDGWACE